MTTLRYELNAQHSDSELYHYGVIGMRWGVRHGRAEEAVQKSARKVRKLQSKADKAGRKISSKAEFKAAKYDRKAARYDRKAAKIKRKASRWFMPMNAEKAARKSSVLEFKSARFKERGSRIKAKQANAKYKVEKYTNKASKLANATIKELGKQKITDINSADYEYLSKYVK